MASAFLLSTGFVLSAGGPVLLRMGWNGPRPAVALGWAALGFALVLTLTAGGAWGLAVGATLASLVALGLLAVAALRSPAPARARAPREPAPRRAPRPSLPDIARRTGVFLIVALADLVASLAFGWGAQRLAWLSGMAEADALIVGLFALPLCWALLASWQLTRIRITDMLMAALGVAIAGGLPWLTL